MLRLVDESYELMIAKRSYKSVKVRLIVSHIISALEFCK
jgi:hypothetical protein